MVIIPLQQESGTWFVDTNNDGYLSWDERLTNPSVYGLTNNINMQDYSNINYYVESKKFSNWVINNLSSIRASDKVIQEGIPDTRYVNNNNYIFNITNITNEPAPEAQNYEDAVITIHKREVIRNLINDNLNQSIIKYGTERPNIFDFKMPTINEAQWQQIESNVSLIAFLQGVPIGTKYFNGYSIATSTNNKEYADPNGIYFVPTSDNNEDEYYHRFYCDKIKSSNIIGYRSSDFLLRKIENEEGTQSINYFIHDKYLEPNTNTNAEQACYFCLVDRSSFTSTLNTNQQELYTKSYYEALARERYIQKPTKTK